MRPLEINLILQPPARESRNQYVLILMYIISRSYVGRVPENLKSDVRPRSHLPKTEEEDYNKLKRETHDVGP
jgi:hypothetical protein